MSESPRYSVSVAAAIVREDGKVLAIKRRDNGRWEPPGGVLEPGEAIHAGLVRETNEETGLTVEPEMLTGVYQNIRRDIISLVFRCRVVDGHIRPTEETLRAEWLDQAQVTERMSEAYAVRLLDAMSPADTVQVRAHDGVDLRHL